MLDSMKIVGLILTCSNEHSVVFAWVPLQNFRGAKKILLKDGAGGYTQAENMRNPYINLGYPTG